MLLEEQLFLCCYSELRCDLLQLGYHIEHVQPKNLYPQRTFDYRNLAASALDSQHGLAILKGRGDKFFAGHAKQGKYDDDMFISCHDANCMRFFHYLSDGRMVPAPALNQQERARASYTIQILNLNCPYLRTLRRRWWDELDELLQQHLEQDWDVAQLAAVDLVPSNKKLSQFFSLTRQFFQATAERVLQLDAPELL